MDTLTKSNETKKRPKRRNSKISKTQEQIDQLQTRKKERHLVLNYTTPEEADKVLRIWPLKIARFQPKFYLRFIGMLLVMSELVALMTPAVAMGLQWVTALCDAPPMLVIIELLRLGFNCLVHRQCDFSHPESGLHCILKK